MNWYSFIFSEKKLHRLQRHLCFWLLWGVYFSLSFFHYPQAGVEKVEFETWNLPFFMKALSLLSIHIISCYFFIGYLMPNYLFRAKYFSLAVSCLALCLLILFLSFFVHSRIFPLIDLAFNHQPIIVSQNIWWTSITSGLLSAPKVICAAAAVKLMKRWWLKQKEKEKLEKEKLIMDLQLLKAQIHPEFLFSSLQEITLLTNKRQVDKASGSLLKLADILSYMLYDSESAFVSLEREIKTIEDFLWLEKTKRGDQLEIAITVKGETGSKMIVPLLLLPFIENIFSFPGDKELDGIWVNLEFHVESSEFIMKLIHGKTSVFTTTTSNENTLEKAIKRMDFYYAGNYELKRTVEPDMMMTQLKIVLHNNSQGMLYEYIKKETAYASN